MPLGELLDETLRLQVDRTADPKHPAMRRRKELVEREIPAWIRVQLAARFSQWRSEGSGGKGGSAEVPWSRYYDPERSPKAGVGWYVVYLFSADGDAVYLSLNQGTTTWDTEKKDFRFRPKEELEDRVRWAHSILTAALLVPPSYGPIDLHARQRLGRGYQVGNVYGVEYRVGAMPSEEVLFEDFARMGDMLQRLYDADRDPVVEPNAEPPEIEDTELPSEIPPAAAIDGAVGSDGATVRKAVALRIPSIAEDDTSGPDRLGVAADARALAALMVSKQLAPPLAVAVYGEWGSGKTFFMRQIETNIDQLIEGDTNRTNFEPAVRHIQFGAWHYAQGNLWASLLKHIFASLCPPGSADEILAAATNKIAAIKETMEAADIRVDASKKRLDTIETEIEEARVRHDKKLKSLESVRLRDIASGIAADEDVRSEFELAREELRIPAVANSARELLAAAREVIALGSRAKVLATAGKHWYTSPLAGAVIIGVVGVAVTVGLATFRPHVFSNIGPLMATFATAGSSVAVWIGQQSRLARKLLEPAERLQAQLEQRLDEEREKQAAEAERLVAEADEAQSELATAIAQRANAIKELDAAVRAADELTPAHLLQQYLADRVASGEYDKHLGVVGVVHRDLLNLSQRLQAAASDPGVTIKRIVLYIDDLDRCSPEKVVQVLEAVHLLLALPLFVVVLGVDRRIVDRSLSTVHKELLESDPEAPTPSDYLEKIFQLTYTLPPMTAAGCQAILREVASRSHVPAAGISGAAVVIGDSGEVVAYVSDETADEDVNAVGADAEEQSELRATVISSAMAQFGAADLVPVPLSDEELAESLSLSDADLDTLELVAPLVAATPRRAKRFLNVFILTRARLAAEPQDIAALAVLVAASLGAPRILGRALRQFDTAANTELTFGIWVRDVQYETTNAAESARIATFLDRAGVLLDLPMTAIIDHLPLVAPYT